MKSRGRVHLVGTVKIYNATVTPLFTELRNQGG